MEVLEGVSVGKGVRWLPFPVTLVEESKAPSAGLLLSHNETAV